jgi:transcriptional regulator with GAF, ATPase, and Fis domain
VKGEVSDSREARLGETFVTLADTLVNDFDLTDLLYTLASTCVDLLDTDAAGIMLADAGGGLRVLASSDERMRLLELFEIQNEQGPCMDCFTSGQPVSEPDLSATDRWPHFVTRALEEGFRSVDAIPLRVRNDTIGALNLFRLEPGGIPADQVRLGRALADVATIGLIQARALRESRLVAEQLQHALNSRVVIEQAKGIIAEQGQMAVVEAFEMMRSHARRNRISLESVAESAIAGEFSARDLG